MKTKLLLLFALLNSALSFSQIGFFNITTSSITNATATISVNVNTYNCTNSTFYLQYSTSSTFASNVTTITNSNTQTQTYTFNIASLNASTTYYYRFYSGYLQACNSTTITSGTTSFTTAAPPVVTLATISNVSSVVSPTSAIITYSLNANNGSTISDILYGLTSTLGTVIVGFPSSGNTTITGNVSITGLTPNTLYYYKIVGNNAAGNSYSATYTFTTSPSLPAIAEFNFNNTLYDVNGNTTFSNPNSNMFVEDRNGNANSAINMVNGSMGVSITGLPISNSTRTVSFWIKPITISTIDNNVFMYGSQVTNGAYGFSFKPTTINNYGWANDLTGSVIIPNNTWKHVVCTYNAVGFIRIYIDGVSVLTGSRPTWNTSSGSLFNLIGFDGYVDDLKIYNYAITPADVASLYTNNTLASQNFIQNNLEVSIYPNPVNDILNIETAIELQSVEIYNIQGQKVLSSNQKEINVSDLASGMYMVRIQDTDNNIATKKIVIK